MSLITQCNRQKYNCMPHTYNTLNIIHVSRHLSIVFLWGPRGHRGCTARHARGREWPAVRTRSRSIEYVADAKLEKTSLSTDVFRRSLQQAIPSPGLFRETSARLCWGIYSCDFLIRVHIRVGIYSCAFYRRVHIWVGGYSLRNDTYRIQKTSGIVVPRIPEVFKWSRRESEPAGSLRRVWVRME